MVTILAALTVGEVVGAGGGVTVTLGILALLKVMARRGVKFSVGSDCNHRISDARGEICAAHAAFEKLCDERQVMMVQAHADLKKDLQELRTDVGNNFQDVHQKLDKLVEHVLGGPDH